MPGVGHLELVPFVTKAIFDPFQPRRFPAVPHVSQVADWAAPWGSAGASSPGLYRASRATPFLPRRAMPSPIPCLGAAPRARGFGVAASSSAPSAGIPLWVATRRLSAPCRLQAQSAHSLIRDYGGWGCPLVASQAVPKWPSIAHRLNPCCGIWFCRLSPSRTQVWGPHQPWGWYERGSTGGFVDRFTNRASVAWAAPKALHSRSRSRR